MTATAQYVCHALQSDTYFGIYSSNPAGTRRSTIHEMLITKRFAFCVLGPSVLPVHERTCCKTAVQRVKTTGDSPECSLRSVERSPERKKGK